MNELYDELDGKWLVETTAAAGSRMPIPEIKVKFGVYIWTDAQTDLREALRCALYALNTVRGEYGRSVGVYDDVANMVRLRQHRLANDMESALAQGQFHVVYQPKHEAATKKLVGAEALVRWSHPELGALSPADFIPVFENNGFIKKVDAFVLEQIVTDLQSWVSDGIEIVPISMNLSKRDILDDECIDSFVTVCTEASIPNSFFHAELTESMWSDAPDIVCKNLARIHDAGIAIELDDFGSGYSNLGMLTRLPVDIVKLDMGFAHDLKNQALRGF